MKYNIEDEVYDKLVNIISKKWEKIILTGLLLISMIDSQIQRKIQNQ